MKPGASIIRRMIVKAALLLLVGAIINVVVAWGLAITVAIPPSSREAGYTQRQNEFWSAHRMRAFGSRQYVSQRMKTTDSSEFEVGPDPRALLAPKPELLRPTSAYQLPEYSCEMRYVEVRGLPFLCISVERLLMVTGDGVAAVLEGNRGGLATGLFFAKSGQVRVLPLTPSWPPFVLNTLLYAGLFWFFAFGVRALRTRRRLKRRLCPACAYPIGTSPVCTECGAVLPLRPGGALECSHR